MDGRKWTKKNKEGGIGRGEVRNWGGKNEFIDTDER